MQELNRRAMTIPRKDLLKELEEAIHRKALLLEERDRRYGKDRVHIRSYGENLYLPGTFGFDMRDYYQDPELALDIELRSRIFWLDNSHDDENASLEISLPVSMYFDMTLFGIQINYTYDGVPNMAPHPLAEEKDLSRIGPFSFETSGEMPWLLHQREVCHRLSQEYYDGKLKFTFPKFKRGPMDLYIQLRGYENFVDDAYDDPEFVHALMGAILDRRFQYNREAARLENTPAGLCTSIDDDWVNFPFITKAIFQEFLVPAYQRINQEEGTVLNFHTCGNMEPVAAELYELFPHMEKLELSGWNNVNTVHDRIPHDVQFLVNFINTFVLFGTKEEQLEKLRSVRAIAQQRPVSICAQAIVKAHPTLDESIGRMNDFIDLARVTLYD